MLYESNLGTLWFVWKVPEDCNLYNVNVKTLMEEIESGIDVYQTCEMQRQFSTHFGLVCTVKQSVIVDMCQLFTGDKITTSISPDILD